MADSIKTNAEKYISENHIFEETVDEDGHAQFEITIPSRKWKKMFFDDEAIQEMVNQWTFPDHAIKEMSHEMKWTDMERTCIVVDVTFDTSD